MLAALNRRTLAVDPTGRYSTSYDELGRAIKVESPNAKTITYVYDSLGRRDHMVDPDNGRTTYGYHAANRMTMLENPLNERTSWTYDNLGRATEQQLANGTKATYTYLCPCQLVGEDFLFLGTPSGGRPLCCLPEVGVSVGECFALAS